ncbi:gasdermin-C-like [Suncus etruscus]|uniref:gasdermin-C-like n=1 Tax=Suncus etruscus TaxID=109475 RepID=UPI00210F69A5|nr:gasdermin-C-like [Suncus etruscus]
MPSFGDVAKIIEKELANGEMKPITNRTSAKHFHPFSLLWQKKMKSNFLKSYDIPAEFSLLDILEPGSPIPDPVKEPIEFPCKSKNTKGNLTTKTTNRLLGALRLLIGMEKNQSLEFDPEIQMKEITPNMWVDFYQRTRLKQELTLLEEFRRKKAKLYVVSKTLELINYTSFNAKNDLKLSGELSIAPNTSVKGKMQSQLPPPSAFSPLPPDPQGYPWLPAKGPNKWVLAMSSLKETPGFPVPAGLGFSPQVQGQISTDKKTNQPQPLPQPVVVAYTKKQLIIQKKVWGILLIDDKKQSTFEHDFKELQEEISREMKTLSQLSKNVQVALFKNILVMLGDRKALQDLLDMMDQFPQGHLDGPGEIILNELRKNYPGNKLQHLLSGIIYILEAIMVLNDIQHNLLSLSMKKKILCYQREVIRSILEPNFKSPDSITFTIKEELLTPLQGNGVDVTYDLLKESGLNIDLNSNNITWDLEAKMPLTALYECLSLLQELAEA